MFLHESSPKNFNAEQQNLLNEYVKIHAVTGMFRKILLIWKLPIRRQRRLDQIGFKVILLLLMLRNDI
jgi:hypothetical protein